MSFYSIQSFDSIITKTNCILPKHKQQGFGINGSRLPFHCISEIKWEPIVQKLHMYTMTSFMKLLFYYKTYFSSQKGSLILSPKQLKEHQQQINVPLLCLHKVPVPLTKQPSNPTWCRCKHQCSCILHDLKQRKAPVHPP